MQNISKQQQNIILRQIPQEMNFSNLFCRSHPQQIITNFCNKQQCQVGLCANCICIHTKMHMEKGSSPNYENIRSTYKSINDAIAHQISQLQAIKNRIVHVQAKIQEKRVKAKEITNIARQQTLELVKRFYDYKQEELLRQIQCQQKKYGLNCKFRLESLKSNISKEISNLALAIQDLNSRNFLQYLPKVKMQCLHNARISCQQFSQQTKDNQNFNTSITFDKNILNQISESLNKVIILSIGKQNLQKIQLLPFNSLNVQKNPFYEQKLPAVQQQQKIFTLRRPSSQQSQQTIGYNNRKQKNRKLCQQFNFLNEIKDNQSRQTLTNKKLGNQENSRTDTPYRQSSIFQKIMDTQKQIEKKPSKQNKMIEIPKANYDFTFGSQFNGSAKPPLKESYVNDPGLSRVSEKIPIYNEKAYNPCFVSNFQERQINNNIKKMERKSNKFSKYLQGYSDKDKDYSVDSSQNFKQFMYRTQLL